MATWFEFHRKRRSLERRIEDVSRQHSKALQDLESPTYEDQERLNADFGREQELYEEELAVLTSSYLVSRAHRMFIPVPEYKQEGDAWEQARSTGRYYLRPEPLSALRSAIRKERKERHEIWLVWLAAITGLVGALTGLAAILSQ